MKKAIFYLVIILVQANFYAQNKALDTHNGKRIYNSKGFKCDRGGYSILIYNYVDGTCSVNFRGHMFLSYNTISVTSFRPFNGIGEEYTRFVAPDQRFQICLNDGYYVEPRTPYYNIKKRNRNSWAAGIVTWVGSVRVSLVDLVTIQDVLTFYKRKLEANANGVVIPSGCQDKLVCNTGGSGSGPDYGASIGVGAPRVSITELTMNNPGLDTYDAIRLWKGQGNGFGNSFDDIDGLTSNWVTTMNNLGIINYRNIRNTIISSGTSNWEDQRKFVFKKLEISTNYKLDLIVVDDDFDDLQLIIRPKIDFPNFRPKQNPYPCISWPSCLEVNQNIAAKIGPLHLQKDNPDYCAANDPSSDSYIPMYVSNSAAIIELFAEVEYLTSSQLDLIQSKGVDIIGSYNELSAEQELNSVSNKPNKERVRYDCYMSTNVAVKSMNTVSIKDVNGIRAGEKCKIKDVAYYDALIKRMIIVNPAIGSIKNHPCNKIKLVKMNMGVKKNAILKKGSVLKKKKAPSLKVKDKY